MTTPLELWDMCADHDWWWMYSDDYRVYQRGKLECEVLEEAASETPENKRVYSDWVRHVHLKFDKPRKPE